jgi:uncharacterized protein
MKIREMKRDECVRLLNGVRLARLACASANQPYVVPVYLAYHQPIGEEPCLYGFTMTGQKAEWMRANPLVCVEFDELASDTQWVSIIVFGRYQQLPAVPERNIGRLPERAVEPEEETEPDETKDLTETELAHQLLAARAMWWEPASTKHAASLQDDLSRPAAPIYYKVWIDHITGYESTRDAEEGEFPARVGHPQKPGWLRRTLSGAGE